jgi:hypothetical protein
MMMNLSNTFLFAQHYNMSGYTEKHHYRKIQKCISKHVGKCLSFNQVQQAIFKYTNLALFQLKSHNHVKLIRGLISTIITTKLNCLASKSIMQFRQLKLQ